MRKLQIHLSKIDYQAPPTNILNLNRGFVQKFDTLFCKFSLLLLFSFSLFGNTLDGQSTDTYQRGIEDSVIIIQLFEKATAPTNQDSLLEFVDRAYILARRIGFKRGMWRAAQLMADYELQQGNVATALRRNIEALKIIRESAPPSELIIQQLLKMGNIYEDEKLYVNTLPYYLEARQVAIANQEKNYQIELNELLGDAYANSNLPDSAFYYYQKNVEHFNKSDKHQALIKTYQKIVFNFINSEDYNQSLSYNLKILELVHELNDQEQLAISYNNIGYDYNALKDFEQAVEYFKKAAAFNGSGRYLDNATLYTHLGIALHNLKEFDRAISYIEEAKKALPENDIKRKAYLDYLMTDMYLNANDTYSALRFSTTAEALASQVQDEELLVDIYAQKADIHQQLYEYETALDYYKKHLSLRDSFQLSERLRQENLIQDQTNLERAEKEITLLLVNQDFQDLAINQLELEKEKLQLTTDNLSLESERHKNELELLKQDQEIKETNLKNQELERLKSEQSLILVQQQLEVEISDRLIRDLKQQEEIQKLTSEKQDAEIRNQQVELEKEKSVREILQKDNAISELEIESRKVTQRYLGLGAGLLGALLLALYFIYRNKNKAHGELTLAYDSLEKAQVQLKAAETRITGLLKQQVSGAVAHALISNTDASKVERRFVCIMFLDIRNYTGFAEGRSPEEIIAFQNDVFGFMINIIEKRHGVVNQLLGDGFMATFGAPVSTGNDSQNAYLASREIISLLAQKVEQQEVTPIKVGIGLHSGYVVTGNVGNEERKQYSITGNTVILAARLEQLNKEYGSSLVISKDVYDQLPPENQEPNEFKEVMVKGRSTPIAVTAFD